MKKFKKRNRSIVSRLSLALCLSLPFGGQILSMESKPKIEKKQQFNGAMKGIVAGAAIGCMLKGAYDLKKGNFSPTKIVTSMIIGGIFGGLVGAGKDIFFSDANETIGSRSKNSNEEDKKESGDGNSEKKEALEDEKEGRYPWLKGNITLPKRYKLSGNNNDLWYTVIGEGEKAPDDDFFMKEQSLRDLSTFARTGHPKQWVSPTFSRDERFLLFHCQIMPDLDGNNSWRRTDFKQVPNVNKEITEFADEIIKGQAYKYKIHFQIKPEYICWFAEDFSKLISGNKDSLFKNVYFKVATQIKPGENYYKNGQAPEAATPIFVVYLPLIPGSLKEREEIIAPLLEAIIKRYKDKAEKLELKIQPRYNKQIHKFIYFAGGEGRDKIKYKEWLGPGNNILYTNDFAFYKDYALFQDSIWKEQFDDWAK